MRILYDHQIFITQRYGGISRYFYELSKGLTAQGIEVNNTTIISNNIYANCDPINSFTFFRNLEFRGKLRALRILSEYYSASIINKREFEVFHPTNYETYYLSKIKKPFVITFHDLINEKLADRFDELRADKTLVMRRRQLLNKAAKIITVSQSTKNDVIQYYNIEPEKIEVIHLASPLNLEKQIIENKHGDYILYVGVRIIYKNFIFFTNAIAPLFKREKRLKLLCAGGGAFSAEEIAHLKKIGILENVIQVDINDYNLPSLYSHAIMFVFPSLYEGFGIPILEAFGCACPTVLSETSSLKEIGGDAALYFNPYSREHILNTIEDLFYNEALKKKLAKAGLEREKEFSWERTVAKHRQLYESV